MVYVNDPVSLNPDEDSYGSDSSYSRVANLTDLFDQTEKGGVEKVENQRTTDGRLYQEGLHFVRA